MPTQTSDRDVAGDHRIRHRLLTSLNCPQTMVYSLEATEVAVDGGVAPTQFAGKNCLAGQSFSVARLASLQTTKN